MKKDLLNQLSEILSHEDVFQAKRELRHLFEEFEKEKERVLKEEHEKFEKEHSELSDEELYLNTRKLPTTFEYSGGIGLRFQFGSIYNNVVNPRFGN